MSERTVPEVRFQGFSGEWETLKLSDVADIVGGGTPSTQIPAYWNGEIAWYSPTEIGKSVYADHSQKTITELGFEKCSTKMLPANTTVLFTSRAGIGDMAILRHAATTNQGFQSFVLKDGYDTYFLYSSGCYIKSYALKNASGSTFLEISGKQLEKMDYTLPDEKEQIQIGEFFKNLDDLITQNQKKYDKLVNMKKACLDKMFPKEGADTPEVRFQGFSGTWERKYLGDFGVVSMNKRIYKHQTTDNGEVPFYKIGTFGKKADSFITRELFQEYRSKYPYPKLGDILVSASGSIGRTVVYKGKDEYYQDSNIIWLNHNDDITNSFLLQFYTFVKWSGLEGSTIKRLYNKNILETEIHTPNVAEQTKIGTFLQTLDNLITIRKTELEKLKNIKKACLDKMFI